MQKTVYLSGKIGSLPMADVEKKFNRAEHWLHNHGFKVVNPVKLDHSNNPNNAWEKFMQTDIKALMDCDTIALLPCWINSPGAIVEFNLAKSLNYDVMFLEGMI